MKNSEQFNNTTFVNKRKIPARKNYTLRAYKKSQPIVRLQTHSIRRFLTQLRTIISQKEPLRCYLRVSYGKHLDVWGKYDTFYNDAWVNSKEKTFNVVAKKWDNELLKTFYAFDEIDVSFFNDDLAPKSSPHIGHGAVERLHQLAAPALERSAAWTT